MAVNSPTGMATPGGVQGPVFDASGMLVQPQRPYTLLERWERSFVTEWASIELMDASLRTAPPALGLPDGAPSPNTVFKDEAGRLCRYVVDPEARRESFVQRNDDGPDEVRERIQFRKQYVALTLEKARAETDKRDAEKGDPETDFWCGFCWIRGGYSPERTAPVAVQAETQNAPVLVFDQPASPSDVARLRHEISRIDRVTPTLPIEAASRPRRGRKAPPDDQTAGAADAPVED